MKKDILGGTAAFQMTSDQVFGISLILIRFQQDIRENPLCHPCQINRFAIQQQSQEQLEEEDEKFNSPFGTTNSATLGESSGDSNVNSIKGQSANQLSYQKLVELPLPMSHFEFKRIDLMTDAISVQSFGQPSLLEAYQG